VVAKPDDPRFSVVIAARAPRRLGLRLAALFFRTRLRLANGITLHRGSLRTIAARFALDRRVVRTAAAIAFCAAARLALGRLAV